MRSVSAMPGPAPFWKAKTFAQMTAAEWESLCDGCGRCCLVKLKDEDTGKIHFTDVACKLFDGETCRCKDYANPRPAPTGFSMKARTSPGGIRWCQAIPRPS
jgi:uncharacterized protein